jgi:hypothetical protein
VEANNITPLKVCRRAPGVSHLLFADDTLLFFKASQEQATVVKNILESYSASTGQLLNPSKCSILFSNGCPDVVQGEIRNILHIDQQVFEGKYLGLPTPEGRMNKGKFESLQARLSKLIIEWGDGLMAQSAREILIKAIAQAIPTYIMGVFKLPLGLCDELTRLIRNYWWGIE